MRRVWVSATILFVAFSTLPLWLTPGQPIAGLAYAQMLGVPVVPVSWDAVAGYTNFATCNTHREDGHLSVVYRDRDGKAVNTQEIDVPGNQCVWTRPDVGDSFSDGFAQIDNFDGLNVIINHTTNEDGTGPGGAYWLSDAPGTQPSVSVPGPITATFGVCNTSTITSTYDIFGVEANGMQTMGFDRIDEVPPGACRSTTFDELFDGAPTEPVTAKAYSMQTLPPGTGVFDDFATPGSLPDDLPGLLPGPDEGEQPDSVWGPSGAITATCYLQNLATSPTGVKSQTYNNAGKMVGSDQFVIPPEGSITRTIGPNQSTQFAAARSIWGTEHTRFNPGSSPRSGSRAIQGPFVDGYTLAGHAATKSAIAFGAVSSKDSIVNVIVQNVGTKKVKVKLIVHHGNGDKAFGKNLKLKGHASVRVKYKKKARGNDLWAEIKVRGKGTVVLWLERVDASGDRTIYPGVTLR